LAAKALITTKLDKATTSIATKLATAEKAMLDKGEEEVRKLEASHFLKYHRS